MIAEALKKALLQAAIQGKLTEQLPEDGDARDLLKEIQKEKARLIKEGKIKKQKPLPEITEDEIPFDIPDNWVWVRLGDLFDIARGGSPRPIQSYITTDPNGLNWIKIGDTEIGGKYICNTNEKIRPSGLKKSRFVKNGDLLLTNSMSFGRPYILQIDGCIHDGWLVFSPLLQNLNKEYFYHLLSSYSVQKEFRDSVSGAVVKNLNTDKVRLAIIPLPSLAEQTRIVEKLESSLPEIEALKEEENKLDDLEKVFPSKIRASILQAAIQGKLTEQLPEDGDARDLLKEIQKEKARLIKEGKIKKEKPLPEITEDEIPFDIPANWVWTRMGDMVQIIGGTSFSKNDTKSQGIRIIRGGNIDDYSSTLLLLDDDTYVSDRFRDKEKVPLVGDVIIVGSTGSKKVIGKPAFINRVYENVQIGAFLRIIRPTFPLISDYLKIIFSSEYYRQHVRDLAQGTNINNIKTSYLTDFIIPLPPLPEQKRLVAKLEEVLSLCTSLEATTL